MGLRVAWNAGLTGAFVGSLSWVWQTAREGSDLAREVTAACGDFARVTKSFREDDDCFQWTGFFVGICIGSILTWIITFLGCRRTQYLLPLPTLATSTACFPLRSAVPIIEEIRLPLPAPTLTTSRASFPLRVAGPIIEELPPFDVKVKRRRGSLSHLALGR